jgi:RNA polymerase sigma-70 factor (ECF subfamily)
VSHVLHPPLRGGTPFPPAPPPRRLPADPAKEPIPIGDRTSRVNAPHDDEAALVEAALTGDAGALSSLIDRHERQVRAMVAQIVGARADLDDLMQDARLRAVRGIATFERRASFATWFSRIGMNVAVSSLRRRRTEEAMPLDLIGASPDPQREAERRELRERLAAAVDRLPAAHRQVFDMTYREGLDSARIAERLGLPAATVRTRLFHARRRLREVLDDLVSG